MSADIILLIPAFVVGTMFGSFLNVCIVRLPADESVVKPRSKCPSCGTQIAWHDNVPVLSWIVLRGKCRQCRTGISVQYPLVEVAVGVLWAAALWHYGFSLTTFAAAIFGTVLLGIAVTDARHYLIPDEYTLGGLGIGLILSVAGGLDGILGAVLGAGTGFLLLLFVAWAGEKAFGKEAMGGGDIKMMAMVGAFVGWKGVLLTIFGGALLGSLIFVPLSFARTEKLVPFGVFLAAAAAISFVVGDDLWRWYLDFVRQG